MNKRIIPVQVRNEQIIGSGVVVGAVGSGNDAVLQIHFGQSWEGLVKYVTFRNALRENPTVILLTANMIPAEEDVVPAEQEEEGIAPASCVCDSVYNVDIPFSAKAEDGKMLVTIQGYALGKDGSQVESATMTANAYFRVLPSEYSMPEDGSISATLATQLQAEIQSILAGLENLTVKTLNVKDKTSTKEYHYAFDENGITVYGGLRKVRIPWDASYLEVSEGSTTPGWNGSSTTCLYGGRMVVQGRLSCVTIGTSKTGEDEKPMITLADFTGLTKARIYAELDKSDWNMFLQADHIKAIGRAGNLKVEMPEDLTTKKYVDELNASIKQTAEQAAAKVEQVVLHPMKIVNGTWWKWNESQGLYEDTGDVANGADGAPGAPGEKGERGAPGAKGDPGEPAPAPLIGPASMMDQLKNGQRLLIISGIASDEDWSAMQDPITEIANLRKEIEALKPAKIELNVRVSDWQGSEAPFYVNLSDTTLGERYGIAGLAETATQAQRDAAAEAQISLVKRADGTRALEASWIKPEADLPIVIILV